MGKRETFAVKIESELKKEFQKTVKEQGLSTCFVCETLFRAWLEGLKAPKMAKVNRAECIVINQKFERVIKRGRRTFKAYEPDSNFYNRKNNDWEYRPGPINDNDHALGCGCSVCTKFNLAINSSSSFGL